MRPVVLVTVGDFNGIGPEIALKAALHGAVRRACRPVLIGPIETFAFYARSLKAKVTLRELDRPTDVRSNLEVDSRTIPVFQPDRFRRAQVSPGTICAEAGAFAGAALTVGCSLCLAGMADAMVTAPISKEALQAGGHKYPGQTEMLARACQARRYGMMLVADKLRVALATIHVPLKSVARSLSQHNLLEKISVIHQALKQDFAIKRPAIAVLGLNPHAGERGLFGDEEKRYILPAIRKARSQRIHAEGPFPADAFFATRNHHNYDAVLAMYHDQGLIPLKMSNFQKGVNFTAGLPIVRTSPDHGTAFDIAGKGIANPSSMIEAIKLAAAIVRNRQGGNR